jgi:hypothetical protein
MAQLPGQTPAVVVALAVILLLWRWIGARY